MKSKCIGGLKTFQQPFAALSVCATQKAALAPVFVGATESMSVCIRFQIQVGLGFGIWVLGYFFVLFYIWSHNEK